ncbi:MAG: TonB-dependent receptor [Porticoccaceae bacterium]|nr:MAG: TonB-dependent receptor [Porticoccaceae bacterium]
MTPKFRKKLLAASLLAASGAAGLPALAQSQSGSAVMALEEIVVTARRREETLQDVPITVNAVTGDQVEQLNLRKFEDLQGLVAGLTLQEDTIAANASVRGVRFDTFASGNNPTVEFYLNDAPISSLSVMQALFDIGQVEVLRGPQGTLRGRASPSGSITITTRDPALNEFGGYVDATATDIDGRNLRGAVNVPVVEDMLALRFAGFVEENELNRVKSAYTGDESKYEGDGYRVSALFEPLDTLTFKAMYQRVKPDRTIYFPNESAEIVDPDHVPQFPEALRRRITADDRLSVMDVPEEAKHDLEAFNFRTTWEFSGQELHYVYQETEEKVDRVTLFDGGDMTNAIYPGFGSPFATADAWQGAALAQELHTKTENESHEIRLQSAEPLFDRLDYIVGYFYRQTKPGSDLQLPTPLAIFFPTGQPAPFNYVGPVAYAVNYTPIFSGGVEEEDSFFVNLTYALTEATEISGGVRRIDFKQKRDLNVGGVTLVGAGSPFDDGRADWDTTIGTLSLKHNFSDDLMAYFTYGESWRPGISAVGDFSLLKSELQEQFTTLDPEESESYEIGLRSSWLDQRLRLNISAYYQEFDNYPYRSGGDGIYYVSYAAVRDSQGNVIGLSPEVRQHNFVAAVPVEVRGVEVEATFQAADNWDVGVLYSYAKGEIDDGFVPCNDYLPHDGIPDAAGAVPTLADIQAAAGADNLTGCEADFRANFAPLWTTTLTSEYRLMLGDLESFARGLWTFYGKSKNDPTNPVDDVDAYNILNLYLGIRDPEGTWEAMVYGKNLFDTTRVLSRNRSPGAVNFTGVDAVAGAAVPELSGTVISDYREIRLTAPQEFGINVRYNF